MKKLILITLDIICFIGGGYIFIYNIFDYCVGPSRLSRLSHYSSDIDDHYYYYMNETQIYIGIGLGLLILGILINKWVQSFGRSSTNK